MQKGGEGVQIACKNAYVINGRPLQEIVVLVLYGPRYSVSALLQLMLRRSSVRQRGRSAFREADIQLPISRLIFEIFRH